MSAVILFDHFQPGAALGESVETFGPELTTGWRRIFGERLIDGAGSSAEGAGIAVVLMMRAYLRVVSPRPPGNVHARQQFSLANVPLPGEEVRTVVSCVHKETRRGRRYVDLETVGTGRDERSIFTGRMTLIWAA